MGLTEELFGVQEVEQTNPDTEEKTEATEKTEESATSTEVKEYTEEEFAELEPNQYDMERVPAKLKKLALANKRLQADHTKKSQELAEAKKSDKKVEQEKPKTWDDHFRENPQGTLAYISNQIADLKMKSREARKEGDTEKAMDLLDQVSDWEDTKTTLIANRLLSTENSLSREKEIEKAIRSFPDYESKKEALVKYIVEEAPDFTEDEALDLIDATKGLSNVKIAKLISKFMDKSTAVTAAKDKIIKKNAPDELGRPGSSAPKRETLSDREAYDKEFEKAKKTGDWTKVLAMKGAI